MEGGKFHKDFRGLNSVKPQSLTFGLLSYDDIVNLSATKIITPMTFDPLGHPIPGGLYDPMMGPVKRDDKCPTCGYTYNDCVGHMGYIDLPVPVINPLFHSAVNFLMMSSCNKCYSVVIPFSKKILLINQLKLLNHGFVKEAIELESIFNDEVEGKERKSDNLLLNELEKHVEHILKSSNSLLLPEVVEIRSMQQLHDQFISNGFQSTRKADCPHCHQRYQKVKVLKRQLIANVTMEVADKYGDKGNSKKVTEAGQTYITPSETLKQLRQVWNKDKSLLSELFPVLRTTSSKTPTDLFFFLIVPVTPCCYRPVKFLNGIISENIQNKLYKTILDDCLVIRSIIHVMNNPESDSLSLEHRELISRIRGSTYSEKLQFSWHGLQGHCDLLVESNRSSYGSLADVNLLGLKQLIEKKEGLIRKNMMGKRVNFAARSVITPDPNLNIDEIGVPDAFAKTLTYPVPVTSWNVKSLRKMVMNGPNVHPGAVLIVTEEGERIRISPDNPTHRESLANRLLTPGSSKTKGMKIVHRHLTDGDILLLNRQPTLHRPSIMAHKARILKNEKTLRLHYSNCKSYNADFDGDEMNAHFPQNELARSEAYNLVNVSNQYLVPKDGTPLGGLIQDHIISGVRMSIRGRFFTRSDYMQLVYQALPYIHGNLVLLPPTILKPVQLWSGKQIISTIILNVIPKGKVPINLVSTSKISFKAWQKGKPRPWIAGGTPFTNPITMTEAEVIIRNGELLCGVLDKTHYGATPYSLVHCLYELYGGTCSTNLLSSFGKLFTSFLQIHGFTLGVKDILVNEKADAERLKHVKDVREAGIIAATQALELPPDTDRQTLKASLEEAYKKDKKFSALIDRQYKSCLDSYTNRINSACMPEGLIESFPDNNLQLMVQSGAKGSTVNTMQISCLLGQIELEGKRPPLMVSGRSLPSFPPYEVSARAGGFIEGRFMTGIQPQEFFFHCMAGREGLIDTAVKTSRSGYLQRCLIKHLEGITVNYDQTVRDSDGCVIQFLYGEDGKDVTKSQFFKDQQIPILVENRDAVLNRDNIEHLERVTNMDVIHEHRRKMKRWLKFVKKHDLKGKIRLNPFTLFSATEQPSHESNKSMKKSSRTVRNHSLVKKWRSLDEDNKSKYIEKIKAKPDPLTSILQPDRHFQVISEKLDELIDNYLKNNSCGGRGEAEVREVVSVWSMQSMCAGGEPVGILAAQSVGEPSTQMTLNTFHFAGRGEMNVTLGIPRLREILMMASKNIKTPAVEVPFLMHVPKIEKKAERLRKRLTRITVAEVLHYCTVTERQILQEPKRIQLYDIRFNFLPKHCYKDKTHIGPEEIIKHIEDKFILEIVNLERKKRDIRRKEDFVSSEGRCDISLYALQFHESRMQNDLVRDVNRDTDNSEDEDDPGDGDATSARIKARRVEEQEYDDPEEEENLSDDDEDEDKDSVTREKDDESGASDEEKEENTKEESKKKLSTQEVETRIKKVKWLSTCIEDYKFDVEKSLWCQVTVGFPHSHGRIDFASVLRERAAASVIHEVAGINRAFTFKNKDTIMLKTDGRNFSQMFRHSTLLELSKLYSNDIHSIAKTYGIEAAARLIVKEVQEVFKVYGIVVDPRHLLLIADYMTFDGTIQPLNRVGMRGGLSPLQQMSFEASTNFLKTAILQAKTDSLQSPSSRLVVGQPCRTGTGAVDVRMATSVFLSS
ncbi:DNA-directed RNA polymerase I subunit RPA1 [Nilaparvata lugens]|uniref:DNA-directed RNA polymerase I subunit RPA1 n=1 Tax=Nilaparvata lugens TaxID=108931 RepID=UPI00193DFECC|nr:DNA-directed RNA polymerase I subunit RPA1 [Nilaparvata lugens]